MVEEVLKGLQENFKEEIVEIGSFRGQTFVVVKKEKIKEILGWLKINWSFNHLQDLFGVDFLGKTPRFAVVYQLYSLPNKTQLRIKALVEEDDLSIDSVVDLWPVANWLERECYDMFGIVFKGHPDLRRIYMPEDWEGYPLRKDYPVRGEGDWQGIKDLLSQIHKEG
ncbi:NADH-quinone oxidoreductase subunit C [Thermodesulfobacterium sp. TA1]|uniref:NADH-quinone oxidoreductase subunit C n=1 Tax=Thermodesulfobacterium sp. TA1 TaxID=2234087 RepID=UPI0012321A44|nr:NADH-quinone oxidoreductase subunit C [Thermodesulfobacterium sp. TA1]QER42649.1 NADH-quinone oxidoreductase subunit C [Thermodesulfobacterium sp. TA1]